jgi:arylsulfatase A-like enzyme
MPKFYLFIFSALLFAGGCSSGNKNPANNKQSGKPNILFIFIDGLNPGTLGAYGNKLVKTPNIDHLASKGSLFKHAFVQVPVCGPSRITDFTGLRLSDNQPWSTKKIKQPFVTLPKYLKEHGYYTASLGFVLHFMHDRAQDWSEAPWRSEAIYYGKEDWAHYNTYNEWQDPKSANYINPKTGRGPYYEHADVPDTAYQDGKLAKRAIKKLNEFAKRKQPFFLAVGFWRPHLPLNAPQKYWDMYSNDQIKLADDRFRPFDLPPEVKGSHEILKYGKTDGFPDSIAFQKTTRHAYYACVTYVDRQVGKVLSTLKKLGISDNTIIVLLSDHGWYLGKHNFWAKTNIMEGSLHVPFIIKAPDYKPKTLSEIVETFDIYPTLIDLAGLKRPDLPSIDAKSLLPLINDKKADSNKWVNEAFQEWNGGRNIITPRYSYTEWIHSDSQMLFDHKIDPGENMNVADKAQYQKIIQRLSKRLHNKYPKDFKK